MVDRIGVLGLDVGSGLGLGLVVGGRRFPKAKKSQCAVPYLRVDPFMKPRYITKTEKSGRLDVGDSSVALARHTTSI